MADMKAASISKSERIHSLDVLRGFSLLGILMVNIFDFSGPQLYRSSLVQSGGGLDRLVEIFVFVFAQASFYPLFTFLFGAGGVMFYKRIGEKGLFPERFFARRMTGLLIIGVLHAFFIWHGDILISYALIGFLFMLFIEKSAKALAVWSLSLIFIPNILFSLLLAGDGAVPNADDNTERITAVYQSGSFSEIMGQRAEDWFYVNNPIMAPFIVLSILPMFLLGAYAMKRGWFERSPSEETIKKWLVIALITGPSGILIKTMPVLDPQSGLWSYLHQSIGGPLLTMFYITAILAAVQKLGFKKVYKPFAYAGRASMSNYLLQSLILTMLFYSYGFGLYGTMTSFQAILTGTGVYIILLAASYYWFKRFEQGPAERWWRWFVYRRS
ncbi:hypothetical protein AS29_010365 [Bacillus sp. SJS]|nr:hypothetical protein AS29_010365 [Bacillus sp. SJS]